MGQTGIQGAKGFDTEDVIVLTGGTLGSKIGTQAGIQLNPGETLITAPGNGAQPQGNLQAETFVPIPFNPNNPNAGTLQDFHFEINPGPGGTAGSYQFFVCDLTLSPNCAASPPPTPICTITQGVQTPPVNGAIASNCPTGAVSCSCENDEQVNPGGHAEIFPVNPGDSVAVIVTTTDASAPANVANVRFSINYLHDDQI